MAVDSIFQMFVEIKTQKGPVLKPQSLHFWDLTNKKNPQHLNNLVPDAPFKYLTDAILGLCYHKMTDYKYLNPEQKKFAEKAYLCFDPYTELFNKSAPRVNSLRTKNLAQKIHLENFEKQLSDIWSQAFSENSVSIEKLEAALDCLNHFETQISAPLIYNFSVSFSPKFNEKLLCFYSFLFHLRSVIAVDHNAHVEDSSIESVRCDSISDYLPKADFTANDALVYWNFKKLSIPFVNHKDNDPRVEKLFVMPMINNFKQYNHNACQLIESLPPSFLNSLRATDHEETLHHVQMDWLLGSEAGLLFKLREELYAVTDGYEKIFWPECGALKPKKSSSLNLCFHLNEKDLSQHSSAA